jgi:hypothetical protein
VRKGLPLLVSLLASACGARVSTASPPSRTIGSCRLEVLFLPPQTPYVVLGQGYSLNMEEASVQSLFEQGCALGADALVAPVHPDTFDPYGSNARLSGTFIRRCPPAGCSAPDGGR